jgi:triosephosphate isomerase
MQSKRYVIGNWKLNHLRAETVSTIEAIIAKIPPAPLLQRGEITLAIAPVATLLGIACEAAKGTRLQIAAQNVFHEAYGAYTGEWSVAHLAELGVSMAIIGHSERRQYFGETSESVALKAKACVAGGITPVVCIGESLTEREAGKTFEVLAAQLDPVKDWSGCVLAYEPIWAIGTGLNASPEQVAEIHTWLRMQLGVGVSLLYGGSVKPQNSAELGRVENVDGFLVGGASLKAESFLQILTNLEL